MSDTRTAEEEAARQGLVTALTALLKDVPGMPAAAKNRRRIAEDMVDHWSSLPNLRAVMAAHVDQVRRMWAVMVSTLAAHPGRLEFGIRRAAALQAREQHRAEAVPSWITGEKAPFGCARCGWDRHHHNDRDHPFQPLIRKRMNPTGHAMAGAAIKRCMQRRRHERATWFRERGHDPCGVCGVPSTDHPDQHQVHTNPEDDLEFDLFDLPNPHYIQRGPYVPPSNEQVLNHVAQVRAARWIHLHFECWFNRWEEAGRDEVMVGLSDLDRAMDAGLDLDDD